MELTYILLTNYDYNYTINLARKKIKITSPMNSDYEASKDAK